LRVLSAVDVSPEEVKAGKLMAADEVLKPAEIAKANGATGFCMGRCAATRKIGIWSQSRT
jgi:biotin synthase-like enzyme